MAAADRRGFFVNWQLGMAFRLLSPHLTLSTPLQQFRTKNGVIFLVNNLRRKSIMPIVFCPECGHEISDAAVACPNCGRPLQSIPVVEEVVVQRPPRRDQDIPKWVYIPIAVISGLALLLLFILFFRNNEEPNNVNV